MYLQPFIEHNCKGCVNIKQYVPVKKLRLICLLKFKKSKFKVKVKVKVMSKNNYRKRRSTWENYGKTDSKIFPKSAVNSDKLQKSLAMSIGRSLANFVR